MIAGCFSFARGNECILDQLGTISSEHLHQLRSGQLEEAGTSLSCASPCHHSLASTRGAIHPDTLWWLYIEDLQKFNIRKCYKFALFIMYLSLCVSLLLILSGKGMTGAGLSSTQSTSYSSVEGAILPPSLTNPCAQGCAEHWQYGHGALL